MTPDTTRYLDEQIFLLLSHNYTLCKKMAERAVVKEGITLAEYALLRVLASTPGITATDLRKRLFSSAPFIAQTVKSLEQKGLLARVSDTQDIRRLFLTLTSAGQETTRRARNGIQSSLEHLSLPPQAMRDLFEQLSSLSFSLSSHGELFL